MNLCSGRKAAGGKSWKGVGMIPIFKPKDKAKLFARLEKRTTPITGETVERVRKILSAVRERGDRALLEFTEQFDHVKLPLRQLRVTPQALSAAAKKADPSLVHDLEKAIFNIHSYHKREIAVIVGVQPSRRGAGAAGAAAGQRRRLRAGRECRISVIGTDECDSGKDCGCARALSRSLLRARSKSSRLSPPRCMS